MIDYKYSLDFSNSRESLRNTWPLLFGDVIFMNINIISKCIHVPSKDERSVHKGAWINKLASLFDLHCLNVKQETSIEDLLSQSTLPSKDKDFIICDLVCETHVTWDPRGFVDRDACSWVWVRSYNFLPNILWNIITFNCINNIFLIHSSSESENEVVFEWAQSHTGPGNTQAIDLFPLIFLDIVDFTESIDLAIHKSANYIYVPFYGTKWMVSMWINHLSFFIKIGKYFIVSVACFQILIASFVASTNQVDATVLSCNWSWIERNLTFHWYASLFKFLV